MKRNKISDSIYEEWKDIVYLLYYKGRMSRSAILKLFEGGLTEWTLTQCAARYKQENPKDPYVLEKEKERKKIQSLFGF
jgi:hypothetical protein